MAELENDGARTQGSDTIAAEHQDADRPARDAREHGRGVGDRYTRVLESIEDGVSIVAADFNLEFTNRVLVGDFGPYEGRKCYEYFLDRDTPCPWCNNAEVFSGKTIRYEWKSEKSGKLYELIDSPLANHDGSFSKLEIFRDITARRELEEQLRQSQKMEAVGRLAGGVAHDFNNILSVIITNADFVAESASPDHPWLEEIDEIRASADRAAALVRQLLAFSRKQVLQLSVVNVNDIVGQTEQMLRRLIREDVEVVTCLAEDLRPIRADAGQIEQAIINLALNASDVMPEGGVLKIETVNVDLDEALEDRQPSSVSGPGVMLAVHDAGFGMDEETMRHVFEPFFTTKEVGQGTGLGLATVYGIVKQTGGEAVVESEVGKGSTFRLFFPAAQLDGVTCAADRRGRAQSKRVRRSETILVIEDDDAVRKTVVKVLSRRGYKVLEARGGDEAIHICNRYPAPIDLVLADVVMPGMSGIEACRRLSMLRPGTKSLYMSGHDETLTRLKAVTDRMRFISKPITPATLAKGIREALDDESA